MFGSTVMDLLLISVILISAYYGYKRGFIRNIARLAGVFIAISLAFSLATIVSEYLIEPLLKGTLENQIEDYILTRLQENQKSPNESTLPTVLKLTASAFDVDINSLQNQTDAIGVIANKLSIPLTRIISVPISFILLFIVIKLLIKLTVRLFDIFLKIPILGTANKILGCVSSAAVGILFAWVGVIIFDFSINLPIFNEFDFNGGIIYNFFKRFTPLELLFSF